MDKNVRDVLERAFPAELLKTRKGSFGKTLAYVEVANYVRRLNEAFGGDWSFDVLEHRVLDSEVVILGRLSAGAVTKTAFGGSAITLTRESGEQLSISDDLKAAASDALKKACSLLGIGLELYLDQVTPPERPAEIPREDPQRLTERQHRAIMGLAERAGISEDDLAGWVQRTYGIALEELNRRQASEVITRLKKTGNGNGRAEEGAAA